MEFKVQQLGGKCSACGEPVDLKVYGTFSNIDFWTGVCAGFLGLALGKVLLSLIVRLV